MPPSLPLELIHAILALSLPPPLFRSAKARRAGILSYSKVTPSWSSIIKSLLLADLWLPSHDHAERLVEHMRSDAGEADAGKVKTIRFGGDGWWSSGHDVGTSLLVQVLKVCPMAEELWVTSFARLELGSFAGGKNLRRLYLAETRFSPSPSPLHQFVLPKLTHLHLKATIFAGSSLSSLLSPTTLPNLTDLDFVSVHETPVSPTPPFRTVAPQLRRLALGSYPTRRPSFEDVGLCSKLEYLIISGMSVGDFEGPEVANCHFPLPTTICHLRIRVSGPAENHNPSLLLQQTTKLLTCLPNLQTVTMLGYASESETIHGIKAKLRREEEWQARDLLGNSVWKDGEFMLDYQAWVDEVKLYDEEHGA